MTGGTGASLGTIKELAEEYRRQEPEFNLTVVQGLGSSGSIKAAAAGLIDFALVSRPLTAQERAGGFVSFQYGRTPFVLVTSKEGVENLTTLQLAALISDPSPTWEDGTPVMLVLRPSLGQDTELLARFSPAVREALAAARKHGGLARAISHQDSADDSERLPGSLGTTTVALLRSEKRSLRVISIDGIQPSLQNFASGAYPHGKTLAIVTKGKPNEATQKFLDFIVSENGRRVLVRLGHLVTPPS
jgi:phosphate transport system substrate-binding protein